MTKTRRKSEDDDLMYDAMGIAAWALGLVLLIGILRPESGWFGRIFGGGLKAIAGMGAFAAPVALGFMGWLLLAGTTKKKATRGQVIGIVLLFVVVVVCCQFIRTPSVINLYNLYDINPYMVCEEVKFGGGWLGFFFSLALEGIFGRTCSYIILFSLGAISLLLITTVPFSVMVSSLGDGIRSLMRMIFDGSSRTPKKVSESPRKVEEKIKKRPEILSILKLKKREATTENEVGEVVRGSVLVRGVGEPKTNSQPSATTSSPTVRHTDSDFKMPPLTLLNDPPPPQKRAQAELNYKIDKIEQTLEEFKIDADVVEVSHGPTVTRYEIQLAPGIKVSKIVSLADNLAMALAAIDVRVEAPIPGKSAIGVEVPNDNPALVTLKEVIDADQFWRAPTKLTFALGKDVAGELKYADLTKMPHLLVAGATNAGKSICLNTMIASLLYRATPREVKFVLIDPKRVELSLFDGIPHLCSPVIRDTRQAAGILRTVLKEMDRRYDLFVRIGTRNFEGYNQKVRPEERIPYIVVIIDELSDLMMQAGPEVEFCICRLAQLARATGIHLVIATQRPSVDVVTGLIKANISSRISFAVSSQIDSRTVLDMGGAERLIGRGDMLFKPIDVSKPTRIQGCFVTEKEINDLVSYLKEQESPEYTMTPSQVGEGSDGGGGASDEMMADEWYEPAVRLVVGTGYASTSMIQRRFKIGYTRAARMVDAMEEQGIVGPLDGSKPREVLITKSDLDRLFGPPGLVQEDDQEVKVEEE